MHVIPRACPRLTWNAAALGLLSALILNTSGLCFSLCGAAFSSFSACRVMLLFKMVPSLSAGSLSGVPQCEKAACALGRKDVCEISFV